MRYLSELVCLGVVGVGIFFCGLIYYWNSYEKKLNQKDQEKMELQGFVMESSQYFLVSAQDIHQEDDTIQSNRLPTEMDKCAKILARRLLYASKTAKTANSVEIKNYTNHGYVPRYLDLLAIHCRVINFSKDSIVIHVVAEKETQYTDKAVGYQRVAECTIILNSSNLYEKRSIPHNLEN